MNDRACASEHFEPGWLGRTLRSAATSIRSGWHRANAEQWSKTKDPHPITADEAEDLAALMNERFKSWTGVSLPEYFAARHVSDAASPRTSPEGK